MRSSLVVLVLCASCAVGGHHPSDATLTRNFIQHEAAFERLLNELKADTGLGMMAVDGFRYGDHMHAGEYPTVGDPGLSKGRWRIYQQQLRDLGLVQVTKGGDDIEFRVDRGSMLNGDSYKGYVYTSKPPKHMRESLDGYRVMEQDKIPFGGYLVCRQLKGDWYLFLFVNN